MVGSYEKCRGIYEHIGHRCSHIHRNSSLSCERLKATVPTNSGGKVEYLFSHGFCSCIVLTAIRHARHHTHGANISSYPRGPWDLFFIIILSPPQWHVRSYSVNQHRHYDAHCIAKPFVLGDEVLG